MPPRTATRRPTASLSKGDGSFEDTPLWKCLRREDFKGAIRLVQGGARADQRNEDFGWTPALFAANAGAVRLLTFLLDRQADIKAECLEGNTPLCLAARRGHLKLVSLLIRRKSEVDAKNKQGWTALMWAAMNGELDVVNELLHAGASVKKKDAEGRNACMWAARYGHMEIVEVLLSKGVDATLRDGEGMTAMDHAKEHLELRAAIVLAEERGRRLLDAAQRNDPEAAAEAIEEGASCDVLDEQGWSPLTWAVLHDSVELAGVLIRHGASPCLLGEESDLGQQVASSHLEVSDRIRHVLNANETLVAAAKARDWASVDIAISLGANLDARDDEKKSALLWAARRGDLQGIAMLATRGASLSAKDVGGYTAMPLAVLSGSIEAVALLHYYKASIMTKSAEGDSPLHLAVRADDPVMVQVLLAADVDIEDADYRHNTPLHLAVISGAWASLRTLLYFDAGILSADHNHRTPLSLAAALGQLPACEIMLSLKELQEPPPLPGQYHPKEEPDSRTPTNSESESPRQGTKSASKQTVESNLSETGSVAGSAGGSKKSSKATKTKEERSASKSRRRSAAPGASDAKRKKDRRKSKGANADGEERSVMSELETLHEEDPTTELLRIAAARREDMILYPRTLSAAPLLQATDADSRTAFHLACRARHLDVMRLLLKRKADVNTADADERTPLMDAVVFGYRDVVEELLAKLPNLSAKDADGRQVMDLSKDPIISEMLSRALWAQKVARFKTEMPEEAEAAPSLARGIFRVRVEQLPKQVPGDVLAKELMSLCRSLGTRRPVNLEVVCDPITDKPRGHAYLDFTDSEAAEKALRGDGEEVCGCIIRAVRDLPAAMVR